jgi:hypothetical protein
VVVVLLLLLLAGNSTAEEGAETPAAAAGAGAGEPLGGTAAAGVLLEVAALPLPMALNTPCVTSGWGAATGAVPLLLLLPPAVPLLAAKTAAGNGCTEGLGALGCGAAAALGDADGAGAAVAAGALKPPLLLLVL